MKTNTSVAKRGLLTVVALCGFIICQSHAALLVISDPVMNSGTNAVNKSSRVLVEAAGATSEAVLEALPGFVGIPAFGFAGNITITNEYIFDFTTNGVPDLRLRYMGASNQFANSSVALTNATYSTSTSDSMRLGIGGTNRTFTLRIDAGTYTAGTFTATQGLNELAFTLSSSATATAVPVNINYYDSSSNVLSAQVLYTPTSGTGYRYTGYQTAGAPIAYVEIVYTTTGYATPTLSLDDLSFTIASEPPPSTLLVISDPALNTGTSAVNKSNRTLLEAAGATPEATLEALTGFTGIESFAFSGNLSVENEYIFNFTTNGLPDLRLRYIGNATNFLTSALVALTNSTFSTSISDSMRLAAGGINRLFTMRIDAGTYSAESFATNQGLIALGFTLSMSATVPETTVDIKYYDGAGNLLSAQAVSNLTSGTSYRYTGYRSTGAAIAYAEIVYSTAGLVAAPTVSLDDLSFTVTPEPSNTLLVIADPAVNAGTNAINSFNRSLVEADGATPEATLEALPGFAGIGSFAFPGNIAVTNEYIFDFTPAGSPDLRLRYIGAASQFSGTSVHLANSTFSTSIPDSMRLGIGGINRTFTMRIDAGTRTGGTFAADQGLTALGFTLSFGSITQTMPVDIRYYDSSSNLLSAQTVSNQISAVSYRYSGYQSTGAEIAYVEIVYSTTGLTTAPVVTLDDLSFAADSANYLLAGNVAGGHGTVSPSGAIVAPGGSAAFVITAGDYYRIAAVTVDGQPLPDVAFDNTSTSYNYSWTNAQADGTLLATFTAQTASDPAATPYWWLAQYGLTNFDADASADTDLDGHRNWQEYLAGTDPVDAASVLKVIRITTDGSSDTVKWLSSTGVTYNLVYTTNLVNPSGWTVYSNNIAPTAPTNTITVARPGPNVFYKITVTN